MSRIRIASNAIILLLACLLIFGCGGGNNNIASPEIKSERNSSSGNGPLLGFYEVSINPNTFEVSVTNMRTADFALNIVKYLEPPVNENLKFDSTTMDINIAEKFVAVDITISHPLLTQNSRYMGFDVRGIVFGPEVLNTDGFSPFMNPADFEGVPFGYIDGMLGTPNSEGQYDGLWGYKYFCDGLGKDQDLLEFFDDPANLAKRGQFPEGTKQTRHYDLSWLNSDVDFLVFNYAVYANHAAPMGEPPWYLDAFPITSANSQEAFMVKFTEISNTLNYFDGVGSGSLWLDAEVWDWQGFDGTGLTIESEADGLLPTAPVSSDDGSSMYSRVFHFENLEPVIDSADVVELLLTVTDVKTFGDTWFSSLLPTDHPMHDVNVYNCFTVTAKVTSNPPPEGISIFDSGVLPNPQPYCDAKEFCVVGDYSSGFGGIYYFDADYKVMRYPIDYSSDAEQYMQLKGYNQYTITDIIGYDNEIGAFELDATGGMILTSNSEEYTFMFPYKCYNYVYWWRPNAPIIMQAASIFEATGLIKTQDVEAEFDAESPLWVHFGIEWDNPGYPPDDADLELFLVGISYPYMSMSQQPLWGANWGECDEEDEHSIDGQVSDLEAYRMALDSNPQGLEEDYDVLHYFLEGKPDYPTVEVVANVKENAGANHEMYGTIKDVFSGKPVDISVLNVFGEEPTAEGNWLAVLETDNIGHWQVALFTQDGELIARLDPQDGEPLGIDCDTENQLMHVWVDVDGTLMYYILEYV